MEEYRTRRQTISSEFEFYEEEFVEAVRQDEKLRGEQERAGTTTLGMAELTLIASVGYIINDAADAAARNYFSLGLSTPTCDFAREGPLWGPPPRYRRGPAPIISRPGAPSRSRPPLVTSKRDFELLLARLIAGRQPRNNV